MHVEPHPHLENHAKHHQAVEHPGPLNTLRDVAIAWIEDRHGPEHFVQLILKCGKLDDEEQSKVFGESLPKGLRIG